MSKCTYVTGPENYTSLIYVYSFEKVASELIVCFVLFCL